MGDFMKYPLCILGILMFSFIGCGICSADSRDNQPIPLHQVNNGEARAEQTADPIVQTTDPEVQVAEDDSQQINSRSRIERAASQCKAEIIELWDKRRTIPPYRMAMFQQSIGEAQVRCKHLEEIVDSLKKADEQLYTYQQSLNQARSALEQ